MCPFTLLIPFFLPAAYAQLDTLAKAADLKHFGTATDNPELTDTAYVAVLSNTKPSDGTFTFTNGDIVTDLAEKNSQILRCHNLVWYSQLPSWVSGRTWTNATLVAAMKTHITTEVSHYKGQCYAWDVVNEALNDDATFRTDVFCNTIGEAYIPIAFEAAAAADPDAKHYYNDYNTEMAGAKATAALNIVKMVQAAGVKIDGVGFQGHFIFGSSPSKASLVSNLESFTALGVEVALTELDIRMTLPSTTALLTQQSTDYANAVGGCLAVTGCVGVTVWDFDDKYSWVPSTFFSGSGAACLFDENLARKPAYYVVASVLAVAAKSSSPASMVSSTSQKSSGMSTSDIALSTTVSSSISSKKPSSVALAVSSTSLSASVLSTSAEATSSTAFAASTPIPISSSPVSTSSEVPSATAASSAASVVSEPAPSASTSGETVALYGQCGGEGYTRSTTCEAGSNCTYSNAWYSQCVATNDTTVDERCE